MTTFFRLLHADDKTAALADAVAALRSGSPADGLTFLTDPTSFRQIPGSPFAYWVSEALRRKFTELQQFEGNGRAVRVGLQTGDDFRFVRAWWAVASARVLDSGNGPRDRIGEFQAWCRQSMSKG